MENQARRRFPKSIEKHAQEFNKNLRHKKKFQKKAHKRLNPEIYRYLQKKEQIKINNELKTLNLSKLANNNISERDLVNIKELNTYPIETLRQITKLRNIHSNMSKHETIYALIRSEPVINEKKYIIDNVNEIPRKINKIKLQLFNVSPYIYKKEQCKIKKRLYDIKKTTKINRKLKNKVLKELDSISSSLTFLQKNMISDYRDENYANIDDIEHIFGDIDNY